MKNSANLRNNVNNVNNVNKATKYLASSKPLKKQYTLPFKRFVAEVYLSRVISYCGLARQHNVSQKSIRLWVQQYRDGRLVAGNAVAFSTMPSSTQGRTEALVNTSRSK